MTNHEDEWSFWGFWKTLPGVFTALATLVTAVTGLTWVIYQIFDNGAPPVKPTPAATSQPITQTPPSAVIMPTKTPATLPTSAPQSGEVQLPTGTTNWTLGPEKTNRYSFQVPAGGRVDAKITGNNGLLVCWSLFDSSSEPIDGSGVNCQFSDDFSVLANRSLGGAYYLEIKSEPGSSGGSYAIFLKEEMQDDAGLGRDAGDTRDEPLPLVPPVGGLGRIGSQDTEDFYKFRADAPTVLEVRHSRYEAPEVTLFTLDSSSAETRPEALRREELPPDKIMLLADLGQPAGQDYLLSIVYRGTETTYTIRLQN